MKMEDILTLCKAGFTAEQIAAFTGEQKQPEQKQQEQKQPEQKQPEQKQTEQKQQDTNAELLNAISALTAKIATLNIQNSHMKKTAQSVDDILASVILPNGGSK